MLFILKPVNVTNVFFLALAYLSGDKSTYVPLRLDNIAFILKPVNVANVFFWLLLTYQVPSQRV